MLYGSMQQELGFSFTNIQPSFSVSKFLLLYEGRLQCGIGNMMVSSAIWVNQARSSEVFKEHKNSTSPKEECYLRSLKNSPVLFYPIFPRNHAITY
jgi:hypothetical protein